MKGSSRSWKAPAAGALASAAAVGSTLALAAYAGAPLPPFNGSVVGFSEIHERRAYALLTPKSGIPDLRAAAMEAQEALRLTPYNNAARLRLAYIDTLRARDLPPSGVQLLQQSYDLAPLDAQVAAWRVGFALEHWSRLTPELRAAVYAEAMAFAGTGSRDANVREVLKTVQNPEGRLAAALWLSTLRR